MTLYSHGRHSAPFAAVRRHHLSMHTEHAVNAVRATHAPHTRQTCTGRHTHTPSHKGSHTHTGRMVLLASAANECAQACGRTWSMEHGRRTRTKT